jgi:hypothetical protein
MSLEQGLAKREIDTAPTQQRMLAVLEGQHAVIAQACRTTPHYNIAMSQRNTLCPVGAQIAAEQKYGRQT